MMSSLFISDLLIRQITSVFQRWSRESGREKPGAECSRLPLPWKETSGMELFPTNNIIYMLVMYGGDSWTRRKAEGQRIDAFKLWFWRRLLIVPWTARRSNQSILKEINPEYTLEGLMLKLQSFGHLMQRTDSLEETLMLGKTEGRRRRRQQHHRFNGHESEQTPGDSEGRKTWHAAVHRVPKRLSN